MDCCFIIVIILLACIYTIFEWLFKKIILFYQLNLIQVIVLFFSVAYIVIPWEKSGKCVHKGCLISPQPPKLGRSLERSLDSSSLPCLAWCQACCCSLCCYHNMCLEVRGKMTTANGSTYFCGSSNFPLFSFPSSSSALCRAACFGRSNRH